MIEDSGELAAKDTAEMYGIIDNHVRVVGKVKCKYKIIYDSDDYFLYHCSHKKNKGNMCDPTGGDIRGGCKLHRWGVHRSMTPEGIKEDSRAYADSCIGSQEEWTERLYGKKTK